MSSFDGTFELSFEDEPGDAVLGAHVIFVVQGDLGG